MAAAATPAAYAASSPIHRPREGSESGGGGFASLELSASADSYTAIVFGASGDLAKKKTYPALFELFCKGLLPRSLKIFGYARSAINDDAFRATLRGYLKVDGLEEQAAQFLENCFYRNGTGYDDAKGFTALVREAAETETGRAANRLFYLAVPPTVFSMAGALIKNHGMSATGWNRVVVEKPFGKDSASSAKLSAALSAHFSEDQIYRIDHYLGKEMVQNLMVLRFGNAVFEPIWNRHYVKMVTITFKEDFGIPGRAGYFDQYGIIRDVMQNHLMQVLSLVAMEPPVTLAAEDVRDEKVKVLRATQPIREEDIVVGQYKSNGEPGINSYHDEDGVPADSRTPTFATAVVYIQNQRWTGVPFVLKSGKALNERKAEVRVQFRDSPHFLYTSGDAGTAVEPIKATPADVRRGVAPPGAPTASTPPFPAAAGAASPRSPPMSAAGMSAGLPALSLGATASAAGRGYDGSWLCAPILGPTNELVIRIQPDESVYLKMMSKMPGLDNTLESSELNLSFKKRYPGRKSPEAYARLIFDVLRGDQSQFVRNDELAAAWAIFTPILHRLEGGPGYEHLPPISIEPYRFGDRGPQASDQLLNRLGFKYDPAYSSSWNRHAEPATMRAVREELSLPLLQLESVLRSFQDEMLKGLADNTPRASTVRQIYTYMDDRLTGREEGSFWGLDIGGTNIRLVKYTVAKGAAPVRVVSKGPQFDTKGVYKKTIPHTVKVASGKELFNWLADACIEAGVGAAESIGFCFSFPYLQTGLNRGFLLYWTKEFSNPGVALDDAPDADADAVARLEVANLLETALAAKGTPASVVAVVNDTVGTLVSGLRLDAATTIGLILGTGTNACYIEEKSRITKLPAGVGSSGKGVVCMEWGGFSAGTEEFQLPTPAERLLPLADFDLQVLSETAQPGRQVFEKLISGKYLGAIARAAIIKLFHAGEVFQLSGISADACDLLTPLRGASKAALHAAASAAADSDAGVVDAEDSHGPLSTRMLFSIVKDLSPTGSTTRTILKSLGVARATAQDVYVVREVCKLVARRAARLVGMALSAVLRHIKADRGVDGDCAQPAVVAVDGSVFEHNTDFVVDSGREGFKSWVLEAMGELGVRAELSAIDSASFEGAAVVAAIAARRVAEGETSQTLEQAAAACIAERSSSSS